MADDNNDSHPGPLSNYIKDFGEKRYFRVPSPNGPYYEIFSGPIFEDSGIEVRPIPDPDGRAIFEEVGGEGEQFTHISLGPLVNRIPRPSRDFPSLETSAEEIARGYESLFGDKKGYPILDSRFYDLIFKKKD